MFKKLRELTTECPICEAERIVSFGKRKEIVKVGGEEIKVETHAYFCPVGKHYFYDLEDEEKKYQDAYREYRKRKSLLQPEEIKQIREKYGLSQRTFARLLGWSAITLHRYETGAIQDNVHNDFLCILMDTYSFKKYFQSKRDKLPEKIVAKIEGNLEEIAKKETQLEFNYIFKNPSINNIELFSTKEEKAEAFTLKKLRKVFKNSKKSQSDDFIRTIAIGSACTWEAISTKSINVDVNNSYGGLPLAA